MNLSANPYPQNCSKKQKGFIHVLNSTMNWFGEGEERGILSEV